MPDKLLEELDEFDELFDVLDAFEELEELVEFTDVFAVLHPVIAVIVNKTALVGTSHFVFFKTTSPLTIVIALLAYKPFSFMSIHLHSNYAIYDHRYAPKAKLSMQTGPFTIMMILSRDSSLQKTPNLFIATHSAPRPNRFEFWAR